MTSSLPRMLQEGLRAQKGQFRHITNSLIRPQRTRGPTFFDDPHHVPLQYGVDKVQESAQGSAQHHDQLGGASATERRPLRDLSSFLAMATLAYFALDNYQGRVKAEKLNQETTAINVKTLQMQQQNFLNAQKQRDLRILKERSDVSKRCFKMAMHIAILKKQLQDLGVDPKEIAEVSEEFDKHVKVSNSAQNLTGNVIWLTDETEYKGLMPDYREYDRKN
ncbi:hypothetical protein OXX80_011065 [Metschnikowia pulcherrima]